MTVMSLDAPGSSCYIGDMVPCPRCGEPLDLDQGWCQHCRSQSRVWLSALLKLGGLTAVAALALGVWQRRAVESAWTDFNAQVEQARYPHYRGANEVSPPAPSPAAPPVAAPVAASTFVFIAGLSDPPPGAAPAPPAAAPPVDDPGAAAVPPPEPAPSDADTHRFYGVVYNAITLKPVAGAKLVFHMRGDENGWSATTNERGHYQVDLFNSTIEKLSVSVKAPSGYREGLLEDKDPPLRERALSARRKIVEEATADELEPVPLHVRADSRLVALDLVLLPETAKR